MRNLILSIVILIVLALCAIPFLDGYFFKQNYYQQIALIQQALDAESINSSEQARIQIDSYNLGWLQSTANLSITIADKNPNSSRPFPAVTFRQKSIIHHGPLLHFKNELQLAYASIETSFFLPDFLTPLISQNENGFIQINTLVSLGGSTWTNYYSISPKSFNPYGNWDGLSGTTTVNVSGNKINKLITSMTIGKLSIFAASSKIPEITIEKIQADSETTPQSFSFLNGTASVSLPSLSIKWEDGNVFKINSFTSNSSYGLHNNLYQYDSKFSIASMQLPPPSPFSDLSNVLLTLSIKDLNFGEASKRYKNYWTPNSKPDDVLQILSPTSSLAMKMNLNTEAGAISSDFNSSLIAWPKTEKELSSNLNVSFNLRIAQQAAEKLLASSLYAAMPNSNASTGPSEQAKLLLANMIQQAYIQQDKGDYVISFNKKGMINTLNGKTMSDDELAMLPKNIEAAYKNIVGPAQTSIAIPPATTPTTLPLTLPAAAAPAVTTQPASGTTPMPAAGTGMPAAATAMPVATPPATINSSLPNSSSPAGLTPASVGAPDAAGNHCYWMDSSSGKNIWVLIPYTNKVDCFTLDSCSGGKGKSNGGCYKWAAAHDASAEPWDTPQ
jgi:hypothetical protein